MKNYSGKLITLEGNEGCGKSTQIRLLYEVLRKKSLPVVLTREPGGTAVSDAIRQVLLEPRNKRMTPECETLLYMASRAQLIAEVVLPELQKGRIVLCDRWLDATVAYQGYGHGVSIDWIRSLGRAVTQGARPALSLYLDLPVRLGLRRATSHKRADRMERKSTAFHEKVRRGYLAISRQEPGRFKRIPLRESDTVEAVHKKILKEVSCVV